MQTVLMALAIGVLLIGTRAALPTSVQTLTVAWTRALVLGLPARVQRRRLAEIRSDVYEHRAALLLEGHGAPEAASLQLFRLVRGMPEDLVWRTSFEIAIVRRFGKWALLPLGTLFAALATWVRPEAAEWLFLLSLGPVTVFLQGGIFRSLILLGNSIFRRHYVLTLAAVALLAGFPILPVKYILPTVEIPSLTPIIGLPAGVDTIVAAGSVSMMGTLTYFVGTRNRKVEAWILLSILTMWLATGAFGAKDSVAPLVTIYFGYLSIASWLVYHYLYRHWITQVKTHHDRQAATTGASTRA